ncbi:MAG: pyruvate kinase [Acidimicrobiales bacterium]|nr:pyruvate kinase [Acidimicrobiales bacterium]
MARRTKIVATIGPASDQPKVLRDMIDAGMDVARISLSHGSIEEALGRYERVRAASAEAGRRIGVLIDLPGPKVRAASFPEGGSLLDDDMVLEMRVGHDASNHQVVEIDYPDLLRDIAAGDILAFGDGQVTFEVTDVGPDAAKIRIVHGGHLRGRPGVRIPSDRLSAATPTDDDFRMLDAFVDVGVDMVALSFVRSGHDVRRVGTEPHPRGPLIISKIETRAAVDNLAGIIEASAGIMVARGDLGTECDIAELPHLQKHIIRECIAGGLPVITATQMLDSMVHAPIPTRAEASDVANAVFDGTSAVMLSAETAIGEHPALVVSTMARIAQRADEEFDYRRWGETVSELRLSARTDPAASITDAMTMAAWRAAAQLDVAALLCISGSGFTVRSMARFRPRAKILGMSTNPRTVQQLTMSWGVTPMQIESEWSYEYRAAKAVEEAKRAGHVRPGDLVGVLAGITPESQATDVFRLLRVP